MNLRNVPGTAAIAAAILLILAQVGCQNAAAPADAPVATTYQVVYHAEGCSSGSVPVDRTAYRTGDTVTVAANTGSLVLTGSSFAGWNTKADGTGTPYAAGAHWKMGTSSVQLYAQWAADRYTVAYDANGADGGTVPSDPTAYQTGALAKVLGNPGKLTRTGYTFDGWNTKADGSGTTWSPDSSLTVGASSVTLYALWKGLLLTVTYEANGADGGAVPSDPATYRTGAFAKVLGNPGKLTRTGYTFEGWNTKADGSGTTWTPDSSLPFGASSVTLYALWKGLILTVTYDANGADIGSVPVDGAGYHAGDPFVVAGNGGNLGRTGYLWDGWNTQADGKGTPRPAGSSASFGGLSIVLFAQWTVRDFTISFDANQGTGGMTPVTASFGSSLTLPGATVSREGYTFAGWNSRPDGTAESFADGAALTVPAKNLTLYAQWTAKRGILAFQGNGAQGSMDSLSLGTGQVVFLPTHGFSYQGHLFTGWNTKADGTGTSYSETGLFTMGPSSTVLYAQWSLLSYTVSYSAGTGSGPVPNAGGYSFGANLTLPSGAGLSRTGYLFAGWNDGVTTYPGGAAYTVAANVVLTAQWTPQLLTVTYAAGGANGTVPAGATQAYGTTIVLDTGRGLNRNGYLFMGWNDGTTTLAGGAVVTLTTNLALTAVWQIQSYFVVYDKGASTGSVPAPASRLYGTTFTLFSGGGLSMAGHSFAGWNDGTTTYPGGSSYTLSGPVTFTAVWTLDTYPVTYSDPDGVGPLPAAQTVSYGTNLVLDSGSGLSRTGYLFGGWNDGSSTYAGGSSFQVTRSTTLAAVWTPVAYTITYRAGQGTGSVPSPQTAPYGTVVQLSLGSGLTRTGYNLSGWTDGTLTYWLGQQIPVPAANLDLTPVWQARGEFLSFAVAGQTAAVRSNAVDVSPPLLTWLSTDWSSVVPVFTFWGTKVQVNGATQTSGASAVDLRNPVVYTITDSEGGTHPNLVSVVPGFATKGTSDGLGSLQVKGVAIAGTTLWAATSSDASSVGGGISRSDDGGATWSTTSLGNNRLRSVTLSGSAVLVGAIDGAYLSDNGGTWTKISSQSTEQGVRSAGVWYLATDSAGLLISGDGGATWTAKTKAANGLGSDFVSGVAVSGATVLAATGPSSSATEGGVSISQDGGATWFTATTANGLGSNNVRSVTIIGATYYASTSRDWNNLNGGLAISTDGGHTWVNRTTADGLGSNNVVSVAGGGGKLFAATGHYGPYTTDGGLSVSSDGGTTWKTITQGLPSDNLAGVAVSADAVLAATDAGLVMSR